MRYRSEIDGLRAIAVVPVILFHAGFGLFSGGFVGVDVFFVISGYLITSLLIEDLSKGEFSIPKFYERRARRILPALFLVLLACVPFALLWLPPQDLKGFAGSVAAVCLFASNMLFWKTSGYFDGASEFKPLLHTWSLAVEEQYYVVFPLLLFVCWRFGKRGLALIILALAAASLACAQWASVAKPAMDFYLLPTRGWELLIGALVAVHLFAREKPAAPRWALEIGSLAGMLLLAYAVFSFDKRTPSPSVLTLAPTLGAALVILCASPRTAVGQVLGSRLFVGIGLISYSAYLWHQPLLAFARERSFGTPSPLLLGGLCCLAMVLAYLSWKYVEAPFRRHSIFSRQQILAYAGAGTTLFLACGLLGAFSNGLDWRFDDQVLQAYHAADDKNPRQHECLTGGEHYRRPEQGCVLGSGRAPVGVLIGDSHADALAGALDQGLKQVNLAVRDLSFAGCPPALALYRDDSPEYSKCDEYNRLVSDYIASNPALATVVISSRWTMYLGHPDFDNGEGGIDANSSSTNVDILDAGRRVKSSAAQKKDLIVHRYVETIERYLQLGKKVILVYPVPEVGWNVPRSLAWKLRFEKSAAPITTSYEVEQRRNETVVAAFDQLQDPNLVKVVPARVLCNSFVVDRCVATMTGEALYFDDNHLSNTGARLVVNQIINAMRPRFSVTAGAAANGRG